MKLKKMNGDGFSHLIILLFVVIISGVVGTAYIVKSSAATPEVTASRVTTATLYNAYPSYIRGGLKGCGPSKSFGLKPKQSHKYTCGNGTKHVVVTWTDGTSPVKHGYTIGPGPHLIRLR